MQDCLLVVGSGEVGGGNAFFCILIHEIPTNTKLIFIINKYAAPVTPNILGAPGRIIKTLIEICSGLYANKGMLDHGILRGQAL